MDSDDVYIWTKVRTCSEAEDRSGCFKYTAHMLLKYLPLQKILSILGSREANDKVLLENCHLFAHYLGREEVTRTHSITTVLAEASPECLAGAFHGALEEFFLEHRPNFLSEKFGHTDKIVHDICKSRENFNTEWEFTNCFHGLGHALMFLTDNDLPRALSLCDRTENPKRNICYDGVFMENIDSRNGVHSSRYIKENDIYFPCKDISLQYQEECYSYGIAHRFQNDIAQSIKACIGTPTIYQNACINRVGIHAAIHTVNPEDIIHTCHSTTKEVFVKECFIGAAESLATRFGPNKNFAFALCKALTEKEKNDCYRAVFDGMKSRLSDENTATSIICNQIQETLFQEKCKNGAL